MTIHKEGYKTIFLVIFSFLIIEILIYWLFLNVFVLTVLNLLGLISLILVLQFFRNPQRKISVFNENFVYAPADGKVVTIEEVFENEYFKEKRLQISIFMSPLNVHINWFPVSGITKYMKYHKGLYLVAWHPKSSTENERSTVVVQQSDGTEILIRQIAGAVARRIVTYPTNNQAVKQGEELGFIKFGSRVDIFLPLNAKVKVNLNEKTKGIKTILAELK